MDSVAEKNSLVNSPKIRYIQIRAKKTASEEDSGERLNATQLTLNLLVILNFWQITIEFLMTLIVFIDFFLIFKT